MVSTALNILLADDDNDDCLFFEEALEELGIPSKLTIVHDGQQLMQLLHTKSNDAFQVLFLDLNMPRKNGLKCLEEIKNDEKFTKLAVIILSTSYNESIADLLYQNGARYYICKPAAFAHLKSAIHQVLELVSQNEISQPRKDHFLLSSLSSLPT